MLFVVVIMTSLTINVYFAIALSFTCHLHPKPLAILRQAMCTSKGWRDGGEGRGSGEGEGKGEVGK